MSVLPWPGVRAWPAPSAAAVRIETRSTTGERSVERKIDGSSPPVTPPGTDATAGAATTGAAETMGDPGFALAAATWPTARPSAVTRPGYRGAGGSARPASPPGTRTCPPAPGSAGSSGRSAGGSRCVVVRRSPLAAFKVTPDPLETISRQPSRSAYEVSAKSTVAPVARGDASATLKPHTIRIVFSPPTPFGKVSPASSRTSDCGAPSTRQREAGRQRRAGGRPPGVGLGVGDLAVAVGIEARDAPGRSGSRPGR